MSAVTSVLNVSLLAENYHTCITTSITKAIGTPCENGNVLEQVCLLTARHLFSLGINFTSFPLTPLSVAQVTCDMCS